jgi:hypothetical protein
MFAVLFRLARHPRAKRRTLEVPIFLLVAGAALASLSPFGAWTSCLQTGRPLLGANRKHLLKLLLTGFDPKRSLIE